MLTWRRRVVTQQKKSPPEAHWSRTVETWSRIQGRALGEASSADHGQVPGRLVQALRPGLGGDDDVLDPGPAPPGQVDAGLDREGVARLQPPVVASYQVWALVLLEPD